MASDRLAGLPRATSFDLGHDGFALLDRLLKQGVLAVRESCVDRFSDPVCALAFVYVEEGFAPAITHLGGLTLPGRGRLLGVGGETSLRLLWSPADWDRWDFFGGTLLAMDRDLNRLGALLGEAGCEDAEGAYLCELAWRLPRTDWSAVMQTTPDFACWAMEHEDGFGGSVHETFRVTAPAEAVERYEEHGWLPASLESRERSVSEAMQRMGASEREALEILAIMADLFDPEEILEWLTEPSNSVLIEGVDEPEDVAEHSDWTPGAALARGRADLVITLARVDCGDDR